jgi:hypothetical protein
MMRQAIQKEKRSTLADVVEWADIILRILFVVGLIVYVFATMNYAIEHDAIRVVIAACAAYICASKI